MYRITSTLLCRMTHLVSPWLSVVGDVSSTIKTSPWYLVYIYIYIYIKDSNRMITFPKIPIPIANKRTSEFLTRLIWNAELWCVLLMNIYQRALLSSPACQGRWLICTFCSSTYFTVSITFYLLLCYCTVLAATLWWLNTFVTTVPMQAFGWIRPIN